MAKALTIGQRVKVVNFHGEDFKLTYKLGPGVIKDFYFDDDGEKRAEIYFPLVRMIGGYPVGMLKGA